MKNIIRLTVLLIGINLFYSCSSGKAVTQQAMTEEEAQAAMAQNRKNDKIKAVWMREINIKKDTDFYLEAAQDGSILSREESSGIVVSRRGKITARVAKDLVRETERSEALSLHSKTGSELLSTGGLTVYAYVNGELTIANATLNELGRNFEHALTELTKEVSAMPLSTDIAGLLYCDAISDENLPVINKKIAIDGEIEIIETSNIKRFPPLMAAIIDQGRMIPLDTRDTVRQLSEFINKYDLYGSRAEFIIPSTRGTFTCRMKNTYRTGAQKPLTAEEKYDALDN